MTVVGTRPELIRLSRLIPRLDAATEHTLVHTGQNWDDELNAVFFRDLGIRPADVHLGCDTSSLGALTGDVLRGVEAAIEAHRPDAFLVLGDTNSCIGAYMARRKGVPVFHMEAGNRCWDLNVPEETNRRLVDHISDVNLCYTEHARRNLLREGMHPRSVYVVGSPMWEVLRAYDSSIRASTVLADQGLADGGYLLVSLHREENVDDERRFHGLVTAIAGVAGALDLPVVMSVHPRTRRRLGALPASVTARFSFSKPFGFHDYNRLQLGAHCVISDSGTISEESSMLGFPAVTPRVSIERPEAMDAGSIVLAGSTTADMETAIGHARAVHAGGVSAPAEYRVADFSARVLGIVLGVTPVRAAWDGIRVAAGDEG
jgi:UDP-N-acetylglucosamine 2-epimerase (non-hydrolysing)